MIGSQPYDDMVHTNLFSICECFYLFIAYSRM